MIRRLTRTSDFPHDSSDIQRAAHLLSLHNINPRAARSLGYTYVGMNAADGGAAAGGGTIVAEGRTIAHVSSSGAIIEIDDLAALNTATAIANEANAVADSAEQQAQAAAQPRARITIAQPQSGGIVAAAGVGAHHPQQHQPLHPHGSVQGAGVTAGASFVIAAAQRAADQSEEIDLTLTPQQQSEQARAAGSALRINAFQQETADLAAQERAYQQGRAAASGGLALARHDQ